MLHFYDGKGIQLDKVDRLGENVDVTRVLYEGSLLDTEFSYKDDRLPVEVPPFVEHPPFQARHAIRRVDVAGVRLPLLTFELTLWGDGFNASSRQLMSQKVTRPLGNSNLHCLSLLLLL